MIITPPGLYLSVVNCWKVTEYLIQEILSRIDAQVSGSSRQPRNPNSGCEETYHSELDGHMTLDRSCYP